MSRIGIVAGPFGFKKKYFSFVCGSKCKAIELPPTAKRVKKTKRGMERKKQIMPFFEYLSLEKNRKVPEAIINTW